MPVAQRRQPHAPGQDQQTQFAHHFESMTDPRRPISDCTDRLVVDLGTGWQREPSRSGGTDDQDRENCDGDAGGHTEVWRWFESAVSRRGVDDPAHWTDPDDVQTHHRSSGTQPSRAEYLSVLSGLVTIMVSSFRYAMQGT